MKTAQGWSSQIAFVEHILIGYVRRMDMSVSHHGYTAGAVRHLSCLDAEGRRNRFLSAISDEGIQITCERLRPNVLISVLRSGETVGIAEVHGSGEDAEIAISLRADLRGQGLGGKLFDTALIEAKSRGFRFVDVICHPGNLAVQRICARYEGLTSTVEGVVRTRIDLERFIDQQASSSSSKASCAAK